ncbi:MAG: DUF2357 domain-containing protein [Lachnospiraceae bacterium]|nr:DUF2357 domain-containing protein [Lachnospiraceae bacterium]GFI15655.1 hypothetical protein IMSAGC009_00814 [Lachnospiraceae bacterium]
MAENTDYVHETYLNMNREDVQERLKEDKFYNYFYNLLETGSNYCKFSNARLVKSIDEEWVTAIEEAMPSLHYVITHPRKFIEEDREVVNVAMARNITTESIRHLLQHSDLIDEYKEDGTVIPNRILNVYKEESLNIYENRFICTLVAELQYFVNKRFNLIFEASKDEVGTFFELQSRVDNYTEVIEYNLSVSIREKQTDVNNETENTNIFGRIIKIHQQINMLAATEFIGMMRRYPAVSHPIVKTNAIGKNKDYKACHKLWNFIHSYARVGYKVNIVRQDPIISRQFEKDIYNTMIRDYVVLHDNMEFHHEVSVDHPLKEKKMDVKQIRQFLDEIVRNTDLSDANLRKLLVKELTDIQTRRKAELAEQERINRQKVKEIQKNQSKMPEDEAREEEKTSIRSTKSSGSSGSAGERAKLMRQKRREKLAERRAKKKQ